ncbi:MAG: general stress protein [Capsulimonas sp.]|uniref:general stress protein n=1 Tax=Capsulimonas sp. TaxID=2494211 RepID=UPI003267174C
MNSILPNTVNAAPESIVAIYRSHVDAEAAVRRLAADGLPVETISIIGRNFETHEDIQGFYRPADAALAGAGDGAWFGGIFGLMLGAMGFFIMPALGAFMVMGPLSGMIAGAIGGAGVGALINGLVALGIPRDQALIYQERLQAGEFLVVVHGSANEVSRAHEILDGGIHTSLAMHGVVHDAAKEDSMAGMKM